MEECSEDEHTDELVPEKIFFFLIRVHFYTYNSPLKSERIIQNFETKIQNLKHTAIPHNIIINAAICMTV